ncbi:PLDc N-terminal domain-containing protein [Oscillospiraceae bacterium CM]|nr:PLDc N-terminal domain-containing protein [Oscillospiraceae bacterium CM]
MFIDYLISYFNIFVLVAIVGVAVYVFFDALKKSRHIITSLGWALFALLCLPPLGIIFYFFWRKRIMPHKQKGSCDDR